MGRPRKPRDRSPAAETETPPEWADNKVALAAALGVSRQTIYDWGNLPGCPDARANGKYHVGEWREFARSIGSSKQRHTGDLTEKAVLEARRLDLQCQRLELRIAIERGEYTPNEQVGAEVRQLASELIAHLSHEFDASIPRRLAQKSSDQIRGALREILDRIMSRIHAGADGVAEKFPVPETPAAAQEQSPTP